MTSTPTPANAAPAPKPSLLDRWNALLESPLPEGIPRDVADEIDLEMLHDDVAQCLTHYFAVERLSVEEVGCLRACRQALHDSVPRLRNEAAAFYGELGQIVGDVLRHADSVRPAGLA